MLYLFVNYYFNCTEQDDTESILLWTIYKVRILLGEIIVPDQVVSILTVVREGKLYII